MKSNWIIAVSDIEYINLINTLNERNIGILEKMDAIHVVLINASSRKANSLSKIKGVISVEPEGKVSFQ